MTSAKILFVEDEAIVVRDLHHRLENLGYQVVGEVATGEEALQMVEKTRPDLILMDIHLQGPMDGITAAEKIRHEWNLPVVYLTAYADDATLNRAKLTEPFGYVLKPFEERELRTVIEMALYKHQAERKLQTSERRFATTLASIGDGVIATDTRGLITFMNPIAEKLTGWTLAEATGQSLDHVFRIINENTKEVANNPVEKVLKEGVVVGLANHTLLLPRHGGEIPIDDCASPIHDDRGECTGAVLVFRDITQKRSDEKLLRQSEARFKAFMDHSPAMAFIKDAHSRYLYANKPWENQFALPRTDWAGKTDFDFFGEETARNFQESDRVTLTENRIIERLEGGRTLEGEQRYWLTFKFPLSDIQAVPMLGGFSLDVTEKMRLEEQLRQSQKMQAIGQLAGGVAHDFNNLLTVINSSVYLLLKGIPSDSPWRELVEDISQAGKRAADFTQQLLAFSRKQMLRPKVVDLNQLLQNSEKIIRRLLPSNILISLDCDRGLSTIKVDPIQIEQILLNLAVNARDAMPEGGQLTITTKNVVLKPEQAASYSGLSTGNWVQLSVADNGQGMDEETCRRIFEPFFSTKEIGKGTGLGLATVYGIVKQSGGWIDVTSQEGHGTTFTILLPAAGEAPTPEPEKEKIHLEGSETILLVEDEDSVRRLLKTILQNMGYTVIEAGQGMEALDRMASHQGTVDLVITDVVMPQMSGPALVQLLLKQWPQLKILFISGYPQSELSISEMVGVSTAFLQKPFDPSHLVTKIHELLHS